MNEALNVVDLSSEAALQLEELKQHEREDTPAFDQFFHAIRQPSPAFAGNGVRMFSDVQHYFQQSLQKTKARPPAAGQSLKEMVDRLLLELEQGVARRDPTKLDEAKRFCLAINASLLSRRMDDIYSRKESAYSRYINHESRP